MSRTRLGAVIVVVAAMVAAFSTGRWAAAESDGINSSAVDVEFSQAMIAHHQQAVIMTRVVDGRLTPEMAHVARAISDDQLGEIGIMRGWLLAWNTPVTATDDSTSSVNHHVDMASTNGATLRALQLTPTPAATDELFATRMVEHHRAGVEMATNAAQHSPTPMVRSLARTMIDDEMSEIQMMLALAHRHIR